MVVGAISHLDYVAIGFNIRIDLYLGSEMGGGCEMNIPDKVKIGGSTYTVEETSDLYHGAENHSAEIITCQLVIRICPQIKSAMEVDFIHELVHGIYYFLGYNDHDEKKIEELAQALYMVIIDNPEIFAEGKKEEETP